MIKKIFYFAFCVFMTFVCFAQGNERKGYIANHAEFAAKERKAGTTMVHKNSKYISLGNVLGDLVIYEKPKSLTRWSNPYNHFRPTNFKIATTDFFSAGIFSSPQM